MATYQLPVLSLLFHDARHDWGGRQDSDGPGVLHRSRHCQLSLHFSLLHHQCNACNNERSQILPWLQLPRPLGRPAPLFLWVLALCGTFYMQAFTGHTAFAIDSKVKWETWQRLASAAWPDLIQAPCQAWPSLAQQRGEEGGRRISLLGTSSPPRRHCGAMSLGLGSTPQSTGMTKLYEGGLSKFSPCSILYICLLFDEFNR